MKALIIEDENVAAKALESLILDIEPGTEIVGVLQSIDESVEWFRSHPMPDLVFMDIHLADGSSFSIFDEVSITCPIIFTTAYDEYALKAFKVNSIDYLLKPIIRQDMERAIEKYSRMTGEATDSELINKLIAGMRQKPGTYKSSLLVSVKDKLIPVAVKEIAYFFTENKMVKAFTFSGKAFVLEQTLDELTRQLNPDDFYRANRQFIVARAAVKDISIWFGNKLVVNLSVETPEKVYVSRANSREFKKWITD